MCASCNFPSNSYSLKTILSVLVLVTGSVLQAQDGSPLLHGYLSASGVYGSSPDVFSMQANPAALAHLDKSAAGVLATRPYMLAALSGYTAAAGIRGSRGSFGSVLHYSGNADYNQSQLGMLYARKLGPRAAVGMHFSYQALHLASGYGSTGYLQAAAGAQFPITATLNTGIRVSIPAGGKQAGHVAVYRPAIIAWGLGYEPSSQFFCNLQVEKPVDEPAAIMAALQYRPVPVIRIRTGVSVAAGEAWLGAGYRYRQLHADVYAHYHSRLGITPGMAFIFTFNNKEK